MKSHKMNKLLQQGAEAYTIQLARIHTLELICLKLDTRPNKKEDEMEMLLQKYEALFQEPAGVPQKKDLDHQISLQPRTGPVNIRLYYYPTVQEDAVEELVRELSHSGVIQPSQSPFSCSIILVKKTRWVLEIVCGL